jgi:beta-fructofuranosidase
MENKEALVYRQYREKLLADCWRPCYHFCIPDGNGNPGDPNGCFFADGAHHLMYLYAHPERGFCWGHVVSYDLLHWRHLPDALMKSDYDDGCFSGGAFVDDDGTAYLSFWVYNGPESESKDDKYAGVMIAKSTPPYEVWERITPVAIPSKTWGIAEYRGNVIACADPSNIWKHNGRYYMQTGNLLVLDKYGREADSPQDMRGDWTELFSSDDLRLWKWEGRFYDRSNCETHPDDSEDDMCPSFLPLPTSKEGGMLTDEYLQLFISHNRGCQYYIGRLEEETFIPRLHGRMSWIDSAFFAPEAYIDDKGRQIAFSWLRDNLPNDYSRFGWSGVMSLPRLLWRHDDGTLGIAPASEIDELAYNTKIYDHALLASLSSIPVATPDRCRIHWVAANQKNATGIRIQNEKQHIDIICDPSNGKLILDASESGSECGAVIEVAPFSLYDDEKPDVTLYIDHAVFEIFANDRQAITRRVYMSVKQATFVPIGLESILSYEVSSMSPTQPY